MSIARPARRLATTTAASIALTLGAAPALADDAAPGAAGSVAPAATSVEAAVAADVVPVFVLMDVTGDPSKVTADVTFLTDEDFDGALIRLNLGGQYIMPSGFGGYASIAAATSTEGDLAALGSLEVGGLAHRKLSPSVSIGGRVGLALPTASDGEDGFASYLMTLAARPADIVTAVPDTTSLRLGASPTFHSGNVYLRGDLGLDLSDESIVHVNLGAGVASRLVAATVEIQNVTSLDSDGGDREFVHTAALSVQARGETASAFFAISKPLDDADLIGDLIGVMVGIDSRF